MQNTALFRVHVCPRKFYQGNENGRSIDRTNTRSLARSTPYGRLKGFVVVGVAPNAAAGAPRHASVFVAARGRVRSGGCGSLVSTVGKRIQIVIVLREAEA